MSKSKLFIIFDESRAENFGLFIFVSLFIDGITKDSPSIKLFILLANSCLRTKTSV